MLKINSETFVPEVGVEPTSLTAHDFESCMFANFITRALFYVDIAIILGYSKDINKWPELLVL